MADIRQTPAGIAFERIFDEIAQGNRGDAEVEVLDLDGTTLRYKVKIRHFHEIRILGRRVTVYSLTTHAEGTIDIQNPNPDDQRVCVNSPVGEICVTLAEVIELVLVLV